MLTPREFDAITRIDFNVFIERCFAEVCPGVPFLDNWHMAVISSKLEQARSGETRFLAIAQQPRSLKSISSTVAFSAWLRGQDPTTKILCVSYGLQLAEDLAAMVRQILSSDWYKALFPRTRLKRGRQSLNALETTAGGVRYANSFGGSITGFGADYIIIDDPTKPDEAMSDVTRTSANEWVRSTLYSRLNNKKTGRIIIAMQRLHEDDIIGNLSRTLPLEILSLAAIAQSDERYSIKTPYGMRTHIRRAGEALHPAREDLELLERQHELMGSYYFSAQYLQSPAPPGGGLIKEQWFQRYEWPGPSEFDIVITSWDCASKSNELADYSVGTTWGRKGRQCFLLNVVRKKVEFPDLKRLVLEQSQLFRPSRILIEDHGAGAALIQQLRAEGLSGIVEIKPQGDKVMRMSAQTAPIEAGLVSIPENAQWMAEFIHEIVMFPKGRHDDQIDSMSQALDYLYTPTGISAWMAAMDGRQRDREGPATNVRLNHPNLGQVFSLICGNLVLRETDGSFLVTEAAAQPLLQVPGMFRVPS